MFKVCLGIFVGCMSLAFLIHSCSPTRANEQEAVKSRFITTTDWYGEYPRHSRAKRHVARHKEAKARNKRPGGGTGGIETGHSDPGIVARARSYVGMTARQVGVRTTLWCSAFARKITGTSGVTDVALSWLNRPRTTPHIGAMAVVRSRRNHVGIVSGIDSSGNPTLISGNHGNRVAESKYRASQVIAYVQP